MLFIAGLLGLFLRMVVVAVFIQIMQELYLALIYINEINGQMWSVCLYQRKQQFDVSQNK